MVIELEFTLKGVHGPIDRTFHPKTHVITESLDDRLKNVMLRTLSDVKLIKPIPKDGDKDKYRDLTLQYISQIGSYLKATVSTYRPKSLKNVQTVRIYVYSAEESIRDSVYSDIIHTLFNR